MPQCKRENCREPALPTGKRYCAAHKAAYLAKQQAYRDRAAAAPECACGGPIIPEDMPMCRACQQACREADQQQEWKERFFSCDIDELKDLLWDQFFRDRPL